MTAIPEKPSVRRKRERLEARLTGEQKALFERAAALRDQSLTDFTVSVLHEAATRTIESHSVIRLNAEDSRALTDLLLNPPGPNEALRRAAARHSDPVGG